MFAKTHSEVNIKETIYRNHDHVTIILSCLKKQKNWATFMPSVKVLYPFISIGIEIKHSPIIQHT